MKNRPLFVFEMANNHQGSVEHGKKIIREIAAVTKDFSDFDYGFKFQYRDLDTFIHPAYKDRDDIKNIKRFKSTRLSQDEFKELLKEVRKNGFKAICTPFDEISVDRIAQQGYDYIKIASCSFTDWPLLEKIAEKNMPVIASGAGSSDEDVRMVMGFFINRGIDISLMHCVAEYPTPNEHLELNQIDYYKSLFPGIRIGFSTHESPDNYLPIKMAIAKGAQIFEKHVGVPTDTIELNGYSANPDQVRGWLSAAKEAFVTCGIEGKRYHSLKKEQDDLAALRRGVFVKKRLSGGKMVGPKDIYLAFPCVPGQLVARDLSKYNIIKTIKGLKKDEPIKLEDVEIRDVKQQVAGILKRVVQLLSESNVVVPAGSSFEISHHYGIDSFEEIGVTIIDCINREYCKKILVVLPGQSHPVHYHVKKEETFVVLHGTLEITLDGVSRTLHKGDLMTVERNVRHSFSSPDGCVFEEISSTHYLNDSFYDDTDNFIRPRKTKVHYTKDIIDTINGGNVPKQTD